jgi:hypothetical protein
MKKSTHPLLIFIFTFCSLILFGCKKQLNDYSVNPTQLSVASFYKTPQDANLAVLGIYGYITTPRSFGLEGSRAALLRGDEMSTGSDYGKLGQHTVDGTYYTNQEPWQFLYAALYAANDVLEKVPAINFADARQKNAYLGEAHCLRAFCHFALLMSYRNIKLYTATPKTAADYLKPQSPPAVVWDSVIADLQTAKSLLPSKGYWTGNNLGRVTAGSAAALLGKAFLYRAGIETQNQYYASAAAEFNDIINGKYGVYRLVNNYGDNFDAVNSNNDESLFELQFKADLVNTNFNPGTAASGVWFDGRGIAPCGAFNGANEAIVHDWVLNAFKQSTDVNGNIDPRVFSTLIFNDQAVQKRSGQGVTGFAGQSQPAALITKYAPNYTATNKKGIDFSLTQTQFNASTRANSVNYRYLRYADVLLMYAEAVIQGGTTPAGGMTPLAVINQVRQRTSVNMPLLTGTPDMNTIEQERILEFSNEGHRFYDLLRWGKLAARFAFLESTDPNFKKYSPYIPFKKGKDEWMPIPSTELQSNKYMINNPGW